MKRSLFLSSAIFFAFGSAIAANAQTSAAPPPAANQSGVKANTADPALTIGEIVVTAQKRSENIQKVPITVAAVTGQAIEEKKLTSVISLGTITSGVDFYTAGTGVSAYIRGFGNNTGAEGNEPPVATYVDGVYLPSPSGAVFTLNNIARIEILKGPQGTLFGRNAAAGAINIITKTPQQTPSMDVTLGYANYNTFSAGFYGTTGLAKNLAADLSVSGFDQLQGWGHNLYTGNPSDLTNNINARAKLLWTPTEKTTVTLTADYDKTRVDPGIVLSAVPGSFQSPYQNTTLGGYYDTNSTIDQNHKVEQGGASIHVEHELPWAVLTNIASGRGMTVYALEDTAVIPVPFSIYIFNQHETTYTEEFNIQSPSTSRIKWIGGFFYYEDTAEYNPFKLKGTSSGQGASGESRFYGSQLTKSYSGYGQVTAPLWTDDAHITVGVRYTDDDHRLTQAFTQTLTSAGVLTPLTKVVNAAPDSNQDAVTYKASLDYSITPLVMAYGSYNRGFKSGNFNITSAGGAASAPIKAEFIDAYEIGLKSQFFDRRVLLDVAGFYYNVTNLQIRYVNPVTGLPVNGNAATARNEGVDASLEVAVTPQFRLTANATYADFRYSSFKNASFIRFTGAVAGASYVGDATGNEVIFAEPVSGNLGARYHVETSSGDLTANANVSFHSTTYFDAQNALRRPPFQLLSATVGWRSPDHIWGVDVWGQNLLNAKYPTAFNYAGPAGDYSPAPPLTFGVTLRFHY
jgi:iron complex outermembrane receptor protein